jgi:hypothetical protein
VDIFVFADLGIVTLLITLPKVGNPVTGYKSGMFRGMTNRSWAYNAVYNANHEYRRLRLKNGENCLEYGK